MLFLKGMLRLKDMLFLKGMLRLADMLCHVSNATEFKVERGDML
jgi:hypothetical protein